jgi:glutaredoxin
MIPIKRHVEVFTAGCPLCAEAVNLVKSLACPSCGVQIHDLREGFSAREGLEKARRYGVTAVPAVAINGVLLDCCRRGSIDTAVLHAAGIGQA